MSEVDKPRPVCGHEIGKQLLATLGLDGQRVHTIDIHIATNEVVTATVKRHCVNSEARKLVDLLDQYKMLPANPETCERWFQHELFKRGLLLHGESVEHFCERVKPPVEVDVSHLESEFKETAVV